MEPKIIARPWEPKDLLDDLREMIKELPNSYMNKNRDTLCMALAYLEEHFSQKMLLSPFANDPFSLVWQAFENLYPGRKCTCFWEPQIRDSEDGSEAFGLTDYNEETGDYMVFVKPNTLKVTDAVEILAHELAHVAVGVDKDHGPEWEAAFDAIFKEYNRIGDEMFPQPTTEEEGGGGKCLN